MRGSTSEKFEKKWDTSLREMKRKCRDLLLEEHCENLFYLMNSFWEAIAGANGNLNCLLTVRSHLDKTEKEQEKITRKK